MVTWLMSKNRKKSSPKKSPFKDVSSRTRSKSSRTLASPSKQPKFDTVPKTYVRVEPVQERPNTVNPYWDPNFDYGTDRYVSRVNQHIKDVREGAFDVYNAPDVNGYYTWDSQSLPKDFPKEYRSDPKYGNFSYRYILPSKPGLVPEPTRYSTAGLQRNMERAIVPYVSPPSLKRPREIAPWIPDQRPPKIARKEYVVGDFGHSIIKAQKHAVGNTIKKHVSRCDHVFLCLRHVRE